MTTFLHAWFQSFAVQGLCFAVFSALLIWLSRQPLRAALSRPTPLPHGLWRFFAWEALLAIICRNLQYWGTTPFAWPQICAWPLLIISIVLCVKGVQGLKHYGQANDERHTDSSLYRFERTTQLVTRGIFHYIRHPMYAALLTLGWGAFWQHPDALGIALGLGMSVCLTLTARADELECIAYFGEPYRAYMAHSKRFIPWLW